MLCKRSVVQNNKTKISEREPERREWRWGQSMEMKVQTWEAGSVGFSCPVWVELCENWHRSVVHIVVNMAAGIISCHQLCTSFGLCPWSLCTALGWLEVPACFIDE